VRMEGLEPAYLSAPDPKSGVSTNFTTSAIYQKNGIVLPFPTTFHLYWVAKIKLIF